MNVLLHKKIWVPALLGLTGLLMLALDRPAAQGSEIPPPTLAQTDSPSEQVRALAGELAARDLRLEQLESRISDLQLGTANAESTAPPKQPTDRQHNKPANSTAQWQHLSDSILTLSKQVASLHTQLSEGSREDTASVAAAADQPLLPTTELLSHLPAEITPVDDELVWLPATLPNQEASKAQRTQPQPSPRLLIPAGTLATNTRLITSLIGRIPKSGQVISPLPFKALVGNSVLAGANWPVPELQGAMLMGDVVGDLLLRCVRGNIRGITLIGADGQYTQLLGNESIGYLSGPRGNPCLPGKLITDFPRQLAAAGLAGAVDAAGQALAAEQQIQQTGLSGIQLITENQSDFLSGAALSGTASTLSDWIRARASDSFDAVVVPSGGTVVANFTQELELVQTGRTVGWQQ